MPDREQAEQCDREDPLAPLRGNFDLPPGIYLDGNSLGPLPHAVRKRLLGLINEEWQGSLIAGWNEHGWIDLPVTVGEKIAPLLGAAQGQVVAVDSTSVNMFKLLNAALKLRPGRHTIVTQSDNFPSDLYMAEGVASLGPARVNAVPARQLASSLDDDTAVLFLTHTNFRTGEVHDMHRLTDLAHDVGALVIWDLSHSAGAMPLALDSDRVDMAVGCGYKFLNGGPGAPGYVYVARRWLGEVSQPLQGWLGHRRPFDFDPAWQAAEGIEKFQAGTPNILSLAALDAALTCFEGVDLELVAEKSRALGDAMIEWVDALVPHVTLVSPRDAWRRGSQVSYRHPEGYAIVQALIARGVTGDFRDPDIIRFGLTPLFTRYVDVFDAVLSLADVISSEAFRQPVFQERKTVT